MLHFTWSFSLCSYEVYSLFALSIYILDGLGVLIDRGEVAVGCIGSRVGIDHCLHGTLSFFIFSTLHAASTTSVWVRGPEDQAGAR